MQTKKCTGYLFLILFAVFIWGYSFVDLFVSGREYSELENRYLKQAPVFTYQSLFKNQYTLEFEEFTNDQFMLRDQWITLKSLCETALRKIENNGIAYGKDHYMFEKRLAIDEAQLLKNERSLLAFAEKFPWQSMTLMLVPTSDQVLADKVPRGLPNITQQPLIDAMYEKARAAGMKTSDPMGAEYLALHSALLESPGADEYLYYRTDHHWTTDGALLGYWAYLDALGYTVPNLAGVQTHEAPDFYGTFFSKAKLFGAVPDTITWFDVPVKSVTVNGEQKDGLYDLAKFDERDKYAAFIYSNNGLTVIESGCNQNRRDGETSRVLVFKDSFGNSFAPFLCYSFDEVTVVDLRYYSGVEKLVTEGRFDEVLFLYSFPSFAQETSIANLKL